MISKSTRGSEWRKWDLHVHTPASDGTGTPEEIVNTAIAKGLSVIAITDHHATDYIDKVRNAAQGKNLTVISGIEFRSEYGSKSVHFIAYFPDEYNGMKLTSQTLYELILCKLKLSKAEIILKGKEKNPALDDDKAFKDGIFLLQVDMKNACDLIHSLGGIISVHNGNKDNGLDAEVKHLGTSPRNARTLDECLGPLKEELMGKYVDICDLGPSDNGKERNFYLKQFNTPSILASDAHKFEEIGSAFTWIKADPSFNGLKQIIYEPESRVKFQTDKPEQKNDYQIIDSITFDNKEMGKQEIKFNSNLNTVIGGRSSGKSILLGCLATAIDPSLKPKEKEEKYNENIKGLIKNASVMWMDSSTESRKILYYSQSKISEMVRPDKDGISGINDLVEKIVKIDNKKAELIRQYDLFLISNRSELTSKITEFCEIKRRIEEKQDEIANVGTKNGIQQEIEKLEGEIDSIKKQIKDYLSESEESLFKQQKEKLEKLEENNKQLKADLAQYKIVQNIDFFNSQSSNFSSFSPLSHDAVINFYENLKTEMKQKWYDFIENSKNQAIKNISENAKEITNIKQSDIYRRGNSFKENNEVLATKDSALSKEKGKKQLFERLENELQELQKSKEDLKNVIYTKFVAYKDMSVNLANKLNIQKQEVKINAKTHLLYKDFFDLALQCLNRKKKNNQKFEDYEVISNEERETLIHDLYDGIVENNLELKKDFQYTLVELFTKNIYKISYDVTYDNDSFDKMSEGKKAFIVLRLLLDFDDSKCPIIIDQPEDDLDNRAIYEQLVKYLREQKTMRQIILATHNPNVVVGADAELVIVANQQGIDTPNQNNVQFEYYGNSIENSFTDASEQTTLHKQGIREHICDILEGGNTAFQIRERKYGYKN
ncbi:TrlF family AAA-like ATPase [Fibrobacter sp.]|uniref:TrlF family AAA-like ATPase n=1 Tax=Fibrobacter sp. TaxID=35828 RepID=UPI002638D80D|nr:PHP domain-containing protein [Fibrobacter sp.]MDD5942700.1 PHP domain-containing protein [Fibrobacter sp.]